MSVDSTKDERAVISSRATAERLLHTLYSEASMRLNTAGVVWLLLLLQEEVPDYDLLAIGRLVRPPGMVDQGLMLLLQAGLICWDWAAPGPRQWKAVYKPDAETAEILAKGVTALRAAGTSSAPDVRFKLQKAVADLFGTAGAGQ